jgi:hypothetical protein
MAKTLKTLVFEHKEIASPDTNHRGFAFVDSRRDPEGNNS